MPFLLHIDYGEGSNVLRRVEGKRLRIGRGTNANLRLEDSRVDLEHAEIVQEGQNFTLMDRDSVTGTYVNGQPVRGFRLDEGDVIEIGGFRLDVGVMEPAEEEAPRLMLEVAPLTRPDRTDPETRTRTRTKTVALPQAPPPLAQARSRKRAKTATVDYVSAYRLGRGLTSKTVLSLGALLVAGLALAWLIREDRAEVFRPGPVSEAHTTAVQLALAELEASENRKVSSCSLCHVGFEGPSDRMCIDCHESHPIHQPTQASEPRCGSCHFEHRGLERLTWVPDGSCVSCHGDLKVRPGAPLTTAASITSFGREHPDFESPVTDPNPLQLDHAKHLEPLKTPDGTVTLACGDCHELAQGADAASGRMRPVEFERHCQDCHLLTFEPGLPGEQVPHERPGLVAAYVLRAYAGGYEWRELSFEQRRRLIATNPNPGYRISQGERQAAAEAESYLFRSICPQCHLLDRAGSVPQIEPVTTSRDWLPDGRFPHDRHGTSLGIECVDCHAAAESSTTADVLIPGIDTCRKCHGDGTYGARGPAPSDCADCHLYHGARGDRYVTLAQTASRDG